jgi:hypothetical protein
MALSMPMARVIWALGQPAHFLIDIHETHVTAIGLQSRPYTLQGLFDFFPQHIYTS